MVRSRLAYAARPALSVALVSSLACAAVMLSPREARAAGHFDLGIDGDATAIVAPTAGAGANTDLNNYGAGFKLRFGDQFRLRYGLRLTPEVGYAFDHLFPAGSNAGAEPWNMNRVFAGARLGFGRRVVPTLYAHLGVGFRTIGGPATNELAQNTTGIAFDAGVAVDFYLTRHFAIGPHFEFVDIDTTPFNPQWLAFGAHADIVF